MVIVMEMDSGRIVAGEARPAADEVRNAAWAELPRIAPRLEEVVATYHEPKAYEVEGFLACLYAAEA